jgi:hypothetical protein
MNDSMPRRLVIKGLAVAAAAAAAAPYCRSRAAQPVRLDVNDPAARALGYTLNASQVDIKKYPTFVKGSNCENCLQLQGSAGSDYRPCTLFPGKLVSVSGWCTGWSAEI